MKNLKNILITGSGTGIGKQTAITLAKNGHHVIATTHNQADADTLNIYAKENDLSLKSFILDVTKSGDREKVLKYDIDVLINNAGMGETGSLAEIDIQKIKNNFEVNLFAPIELTQLVLKQMIKQDSGRVIFISSLLGRIIKPFFGPYSMTKYALSSGAESLRVELSQITKNVHISVVEPGSYHTGFNQKMIGKMFQWMDEKSYFYHIKDKIKSREEREFKYSESRDITSIVEKIVQALEDANPKFRYSAPTWQYLGVQLLRIFGR
ncbi:SDR family NAD(P)-dependent oxidoreductase [soil metagenome]